MLVIQGESSCPALGQLSQACVCPPYSYPREYRAPGTQRSCRAVTVAWACWLKGASVSNYRNDGKAWCVCGRESEAHVNSSEECHGLLPRAQVRAPCEGCPCSLLILPSSADNFPCPQGSSLHSQAMPHSVVSVQSGMTSSGINYFVFC